MGEISATDRGALMAAFRASAADYFFVHVDPLVPAAEAVAERHGLRAYDAVQLAAAMEARGRLSPALAASFVMVAADTQLLAAAAAEGLATEDPNQH